MSQTCYLQPIFDKGSRTRAINYVLKTLSNIEHDAIAFSGMSGALIASIIADRTGKGLIMVRKAKDCSHSFLTVESTAYAKSIVKYVVIDDLIVTCRTVNRIIQHVEEDSINYNHSEMVCVGVLLYSPAKDITYSKEIETTDGRTVPLWSRKFKNNS